MAFEPAACVPFDVVALPFPFADRAVTVARPAIVLTDYARFGRTTGIVMVAMITSARASSWPLDTPIADLASAGLTVPCVMRGKINAVDYGLIDRKIGEIAKPDRTAITAALRELFAAVV